MFVSINIGFIILLLAFALLSAAVISYLRPVLCITRVVWVTFCTDRNTMSDAEVITKLQELTDEGLSLQS